MRAGVLVGLLGGLAGSALQLVAMFTRMPYATWDRANSALFVAFCLAVIWLGVRVGRARRGERPSVRLVAPVAAAVVVCGALNLLTYAVATGPFAAQVRQVPFFVNDLSYRGYPSAAAYLTTPGNYGALFRLQMFSGIVVGVLQLALGGAAAGAASTRHRATAGHNAREGA